MTTDDKLVGLLTQADILMELALAMRRDASCVLMGQCKLAQFDGGIGCVVPVTVLKSRSVGEAIEHLDYYQFSSLAVVNESGRLVGNFSLTNLLDIWLEKEESIGATLALSIEEYLSIHSPGV